MIFATVGTQLPFDRLLSGLNSWAMRNPDMPVVAQTGSGSRGYAHLKTVPHLSQSDFRAYFKAAQLVVAHAGMGSILSAAEMGKPIILMPRRAKFHEHRNDHQQDTATEMSRLSNVTVVQDGEALHDALDRAVAQGLSTAAMSPTAHSTALDPLIETVRDFVWAGFETARSRDTEIRDQAA